MKCPKCGFVETGDEQKCRYCDAPLQRSIIPFPLNQANADTSTPEKPQPDWRAEVRERTKAFQARKKRIAAMQEAAQKEQSAVTNKEDPARATNPIVEAWRNRLRRNNSNDFNGLSTTRAVQAPDRGAMSRVDASGDKKTSLTDPAAASDNPPTQGDRLPPRTSASAAPAYEVVKSREDSLTLADAGISPSPPTTVTTTAGDDSVSTERRPAEAELRAQSREPLSVAYHGFSGVDASAESEPEVDTPRQRKQAQAPVERLSDLLGQQSSEPRVRLASLWQRLGAGIVDGLLLLLVNIPFIALIELSQGNLSDPRVQLVLISIGLILHLFYTTLMLMAAGQTIGMMMTGIVAVSRQSSNLPSFRQALSRALGFLLAAAPAFFGFLFPAFDPKGRSLSDIISGTIVNRTVEEIDDLQIPWLYHHIRS